MVIVLAQEQEHNVQENFSPADNIQNHPHSLQSSVKDSIHATLNSLKKAAQPADSLYAVTKDSLNAIKSKASEFKDIISSPVDSINQKMNSLQSGVSNKADSLQEKMLSTKDKLLNKGDSVRASAANVINQQEQKVQQLYDSLSGKLGGKMPDIPEEMNINNKLSLPEAGLENIPVQEINLPELSGENAAFSGFKQVKLPDKEFSGEMSDMKPKVPGNIKKISSGGAGAKEKVGQKMAPLQNIKNDASEMLAPVKKIKGRAGEVTDKIKEIKHDSVNWEMEAEKLAEKALENQEEIAILKEAKEQVKSPKAIHEQYMSQLSQAKQAYRAEWLQQDVHQAAFKQIEKNPEVFQKAQEKFSKIKNKNIRIDSVKGIRINKHEQQHLSFWERLTPGFTLQYEKATSITLDIAPQAGYKINSLFTIGSGYSYRLNATNELENITARRDVYGGKIFGETYILKGLSLRAEYEKLRTNIPTGPSTDGVYRDWIVGLNGGVVKNFKIQKKIKGEMQVLYNFLYQEGKTPFIRPLNIRVGLEFNYRQTTRKRQSRNE